jgi:hypothetical protein
MKRKRKRCSKKQLERLERQEAERDAKARSESEERQEKIKVLWDLDEQQLKAAKKPTERKDIEQKLKTQKLKKLLNGVRKLADDEKIIDRIHELVELAGLQDRQIEYLTQLRRDWELIQDHYPQQLENLYWESLMALVQLGLPYLPKRKPETEWEYKRRVQKLPGGVGLIEYEFGGAGQAEWRKLTSLPGLPYQPTCLDNIFAGGAVKIRDSEEEVFFIGQPHRIPKPGLQSLFGMHRNRFPKNPPPKDGRETWYDFRAVTKIMEALLGEPERKTSARGAPLRLWLNDPDDPDLRTRVLTGIEARIASIPVEKKIATAFLRVVRQFLPNSAKK